MVLLASVRSGSLQEAGQLATHTRPHCAGTRDSFPEGEVRGRGGEGGRKATYSIMWSEPQSHMFSKYPDANGVRCIIRLAALHP